MKYFIFNMHLGDDSNYTVVFDFKKEFNEIELREDVIDFHSINETCRKTIYLLPRIGDNLKVEIAQSVASVFNNSEDDISLIYYDLNGLFAQNPEQQELCNRIKYYGLMQIVRSRNALIEGDDLFHFVLPSKKHSPFFIRTANILKDASEINFIAFCLIDELKGVNINYIVCDTSSIISIGYAFSFLKSLFMEGPNIPIQSFGSYAGMKSFKFRPRTLVLISATNSGDLEKQLVNTVNEKDLEIITIIYNSRNEVGRMLININGDFQNLLSYKKSKHYIGTNENCDYCNQNSIPVLVRGDQFIPSRVIPQKILIYKRHVPSWVREVMPLVSCTKAITCFRSENIKSKKRELYIDFEKLFRSSVKQGLEFRKMVKRTIQNLIPASTSIIIYVKDNSSKVVAQKIFKELKSLGKQIQEPIPHDRILELKSREKDNSHTFVVVASCLATGNKLNSISRELRDFKSSSVHYISILARLENESKLQVLESNLKYRSDKSDNINVFHSVLCSYVGDYHDKRRTEFNKPSWSEEIIFFDKMEIELLPLLFKERLEKLKGNYGLINNLFFKNPFNGKDLYLRNNFALYDFSERDKPSQADVFLIVSATFHFLRNPSFKPSSKIDVKEKFLVQHEHVKSVIDPQIFNRYNDGILQACILRIARPIELSYLTEEESLEMSRTIIDLFKNQSDEDKNEAILEFLYALATKKMTLLPDHLGHLHDHLAEEFYANEEIKFFLDFISHYIINE